MSGKILGLAILLPALVAGVLIYYFQVYAYYETVTPSGTDDVQLTALGTGQPETILYEDFRAIDSDSSPIRYRACFTTPTPLGTLAATYEPYSGAEPRNAPGWFDCFDADAIGSELRAGRAKVFVGTRNLEFGIDRVVAVTEDGRGYIWHEINDCGDRAYDGSPLGQDCPDRDNGDT